MIGTGSEDAESIPRRENRGELKEGALTETIDGLAANISISFLKVI
jgi:hypothetical protein